MRLILESLFGVYTPVQGVIGVDSADVPIIGIIPGVAGVDWEYVLGVLLFTVCLYAFFRILGIIVKE